MSTPEMPGFDEFEEIVKSSGLDTDPRVATLENAIDFLKSDEVEAETWEITSRVNEKLNISTRLTYFSDSPEPRLDLWLCTNEPKNSNDNPSEQAVLAHLSFINNAVANDGSPDLSPNNIDRKMLAEAVLGACKQTRERKDLDLAFREAAIIFEGFVGYIDGEFSWRAWGNLAKSYGDRLKNIEDTLIHGRSLHMVTREIEVDLGEGTYLYVRSNDIKANKSEFGAEDLERAQLSLVKGGITTIINIGLHGEVSYRRNIKSQHTGEVIQLEDAESIPALELHGIILPVFEEAIYKKLTKTRFRS